MKGFTLVEMMITAIIIFFLLAAVLAVFLVGDKIWQIETGLVQLQQQARGALTAMVREIRQSSNSNLTISNGSLRIEFNIPDASNSIAYELINDQLIRQHPANTTRVVTGEVSSLSFCCWQGGSCGSDCSSSRLLEINLGLEKTVREADLAFSLTQKVRLRNE